MLREYFTPEVTSTTDEDTVYSLLAKRAFRSPQSQIAKYADDSGSGWVAVTAEEMLATVRKVAKGLIALGVKKGDNVLIYSPTRYEWGITDFACAAIGAVTVPVYETDSVSQVQTITEETKPVIAFVSDAGRGSAVESVRSEIGSIKYLFTYDSGGLDSVAEWGEGVSEKTLDAAIEKVKADDVLTIVFTSGSTGKSKGVVLTNRNFTHIVFAGYDVVPHMLYKDPTRLLLFLPLAHCFARFVQYAAVGASGTIGYVSDAKHLLADLRSFKPTYLLAVPRVFEKVYNAASQKAGAGVKGHVFAAAFAHYVQWDKDEQAGIPHSFKDKMKHKFYEGAIGSSLRSALGNSIDFLASGGAPMDTDLAHFFNAIDGITFIQGYGLTETAAPCLVNFENANRIGSVGKPGPGIGVRLSDDDELEIKGDGVFKGYYNNEKMTREAFDGDWLRTGDLASIDDDGFVYITGRKKDIIITAGGKNISPSPMESILKSCPIVSQAVVVGDNMPFISALITLDEGMLETWKKTHGMGEDIDLKSDACNEAVRGFVQQYVDKVNSTVSRAESIRKFVILPEDFSQESGTMTASLKVIRPAVIRKYDDVIKNELYAPQATSMSPAPSAKIMSSAAQVRDAAAPFVEKNAKRISDAAAPFVEKSTKRISDAVANAARRIAENADSIENNENGANADFASADSSSGANNAVRTGADKINRKSDKQSSPDFATGSACESASESAFEADSSPDDKLSDN